MTKNNKKIDTIDEGLMDLPGDIAQGFRKAISKDWATNAIRSKSYNDTKNKFVRSLQLALDSGIKGGAVQDPSKTQPTQPTQQTPHPAEENPNINLSTNESKNGVGKYLNSFESFMNTKLVESIVLNEATVADFIKRYAKAQGSGYDWQSHENELNTISNLFQQEYQKLGKFPAGAAGKLFDFIYSVGSQQQRDPGGTVKGQSLFPRDAEKVEGWARGAISEINDPKILYQMIEQLVALMTEKSPTDAKKAANSGIVKGEERLKQAASAAQSRSQVKAQATAESKKLRKKSV